MIASTDWLSGLKEGDKVAIALDSIGHKAVRYRFSSVQRLTKLHIVVNDTKYRKNDGQEVGASVWHGKSLTEPTEQVYQDEMRARRYDMVRQISWDTIPDHIISQVLGLVATERDTEQP